MAQNLFTAGDLPPGDPNLWAEDSARTFGYKIRFAVAGTVTQIGVYGPASTPPATWRVKLFDGAQTLLAAKTGPAMNTTAWNWVTLDSAVSVQAATDYIPCFYMSGEGNYAHTTNGLASNKTNGDLTAPANSGHFKGGSLLDDFPNDGTTYAGLFFVDVVFETPAGHRLTYLHTLPTVAVHRAGSW